MARDNSHLADNSWFSLLIPSADAVRNAQSLFENGYRALSEESLHFINKRHEHNSQAIEQYRDSKSPATFLLAQQDWALHLLRDYADGTAHVSETMRKCFTRGAGKERPR